MQEAHPAASTSSSDKKAAHRPKSHTGKNSPPKITEEKKLTAQNHRYEKTRYPKSHRGKTHTEEKITQRKKLTEEKKLPPKIIEGKNSPPKITKSQWTLHSSKSHREKNSTPKIVARDKILITGRD